MIRSSRANPDIPSVMMMRWVIAGFALVVAGWMAFDGAHALVTGDYVTPSSGEYAGQLGPWSYVVEAAGIAPRGTGMKWFFFLYGAAWLFVIASFMRRIPWTRWGMLIFAVGSLWYLPFGTAIGSAQILFLIFFARRLN